MEEHTGILFDGIHGSWELSLESCLVVGGIERIQSFLLPSLFPSVRMVNKIMRGRRFAV